MANGLYLAASPEGTIDLPVVAYYDGLGFMVRKDLGVKIAKELDGAVVCVNVGAGSEPDLADFFRANAMNYKSVRFAKAGEAVAAYAGGRCDALALPRTSLLAARTRIPRPDDHMIPARTGDPGTHWPRGAPWRRPVGRHHPVGGKLDDPGRRARHHGQQRRAHAVVEQESGNPEALGNRGFPRKRARSQFKLCLRYHPVGWKLRRDFQPKSGQGLAVQGIPRGESAMDQGH